KQNGKLLRSLPFCLLNQEALRSTGLLVRGGKEDVCLVCRGVIYRARLGWPLICRVVLCPARPLPLFRRCCQAGSHSTSLYRQPYASSPGPPAWYRLQALCHRNG